MNKKGDLSVGLGIIVAAIVLLIAGGGVLYASQKGMSSFGKGFSAEELRLNQNACLTKGIVNPQLLTNDNDKYPNSCDVCPWCDSSIDADADYMPDCCDKEPENSRIFECISGMDREKFQCKKPVVQTAGRSQQQRESQNKLNADAKEKYDLALVYINQEDYTTAYSLIKNVLSNYRGTAVYNDAVTQFQRFELFFENDTQKLLQFYRDGMQMGFGEYELKMALAYKNMVIRALTQSTPEAAEVFIKQFETESEAFEEWSAQTKDYASEIYYKTASAFLEKGNKEKAIEYYKLVVDLYPDASYGTLARSAFDRLYTELTEETALSPQEQQELADFNHFKLQVITAFTDRDLNWLENSIIPTFEMALANQPPITTRGQELAAEIYYKIARTFQTNGQPEKAKSYYGKVFLIYPTTTYAAFAREEYNKLG